MTRTSRLLELIDMLRMRRLAATASDLAEQMGVSPRSIYRDIETLRSLGAPIEGQAGVGYRLRDGFFLPPFSFTQNELDVLILGLSWVREQTDPKLSQSSERALAKIMFAANRGNAPMPEAPALLAAASTSRPDDPAAVAALRDAIRRQHKVSITYEDLRGAASDRIIWPIAMVYFDDVRVLAAWCELRSAYRHFRVDRIKVTEVLEERYPGQRHVLYARWREQDRDWRSMLTVSDTVQAYNPADMPASGTNLKDY